MSPVPPTEGETAPPMADKNAGFETGNTTDGAVPTRVDAYRSRGIRSKHSPMDLVPILLRVLSAVFALIAFAIIASDTTSVVLVDTLGFASGFTFHFNDFFFFSYLLTVNVIVFCYALATIFLSLFLLSKSTVSSNLLIGTFALDLILSYLLMSASTSAATGMRIYYSLLSNAISSSFKDKAYAAVAFSFLAFFVLAAASLISGLRVLRRQ